MKVRKRKKAIDKNAYISVANLLQNMNIGADCESCPRWHDGGCKGHLSWVCNAIAYTESGVKK